MRGGMKRGGATLEEMKQALKGKLYPGKAGESNLQLCRQRRRLPAKKKEVGNG